MKNNKYIYKLLVLSTAILVLALNILPEYRSFVYIAFTLNIILLAFLLKNKIIKIKIKRLYISIFLVFSSTILISAFISYLFSLYINPYINISPDAPTNISREEKELISKVKQEVEITYLGEDKNSRLFFKNILKKVNKINNKISYKALAPIIDDTKYFQLRSSYPSFVLGSVLIEGERKALVYPSFSSKTDIIKGLKSLTKPKKNICFSTKSTQDISTIINLLKTNSHNLSFNIYDSNCDTIIIYDKVSKEINLEKFIKNKKNKNIIIFTSTNQKKKIGNLLKYLNTKISTCKSMDYLAYYSEIKSRSILDFSIADTGEFCIDNTNSFYKKINNIKIISSNIIDNKLIDFEDNTKFILSLIDNNIEKEHKKNPPRAISPSGFKILIFILLTCLLILF